MSPNLSSQHFPPNRLLYEQVISINWKTIYSFSCERRNRKTIIFSHLKIESPNKGISKTNNSDEEFNDYQMIVERKYRRSIVVCVRQQSKDVP